MKVILILIGSVTVMSIIMTSCGNDNETWRNLSWPADSAVLLCHPDTLEKWRQWAMRTDEGLWENDPAHNVRLELVKTYGGEEEIEPPFYRINWVHVSGDTIFISDQAQEALICMGMDGSVYWKYGEPGEGPGHFCWIGATDTGSNWIAVCNTNGDKVEILSRDGQRMSIINISNPQDVITLTDTTIAILSKAEPGGDVHVYQLLDTHLYSFGEAPWTHRGVRANRDLGCLLFGDTLVVTSKFCNQIFFYDLENKTLSDDFARKYPTEYQITHGGLAWHVSGRPFLGPDSVLCINLPPFSYNAEFKITYTPFEEWQSTTIIDRYNFNGNYLDSFCIPLRGGFYFSYSLNYGLFVAQTQTGTLYRFEVIVVDD